MPTVVTTVARWRALAKDLRASGRSIGFVPTMGALHAGHASLFKEARKRSSFVLASVFVNPTQFDESWDFEQYPRTLEADCAIMELNGVDAVFAPTVEEMYPDGRNYSVTEEPFSQELCGAHRPGHFKGVLTVVMKLLQIADADKAFFGEKDYQQLKLIRGMAQAFFLRTKIIGCPTVRESDGLAMSSRNARLNPKERSLAPRFAKILHSSQSPSAAKAALEAASFKVDYIADLDGRRLGAVRLGKTRLIDNVVR